MTNIFLVSVIDMEPYSNYGDGPAKAFKTRKAAEKFVKEHSEVYGEGYFKWDDMTKTDVPCDEGDENAFYEYGWSYSTHIQQIELIEDK